MKPFRTMDGDGNYMYTLLTQKICLEHAFLQPGIFKTAQMTHTVSKTPTWTPLFFNADPTNTGVKLLLIVARRMAA